jgi:hypothetical protein
MAWEARRDFPGMSLPGATGASLMALGEGGVRHRPSRNGNPAHEACSPRRLRPWHPDIPRRSSPKGGVSCSSPVRVRET